MDADAAAEEREARAFHQERAWDATALGLEGLNLLSAGLRRLEGSRFDERPEQRVMATCFVQAHQSLTAALDLACAALYPQALTLARGALEDLVGYWYVRQRPEDHWRFVTVDDGPPSVPEMLERIEPRALRERLRRLGPLGRFTRAWVQGGLQGAPAFAARHRARRLDEAFFRAAIAEWLAILGLHLEALDDFLRLAGRAPAPGLAAYAQRVEAWQRRQARLLSRLGPTG